MHFASQNRGGSLALFQTEFRAPRLRDHMGRPSGLPNDFDVCGRDRRQGFDALAGIVCDDGTHAASLRSEGHLYLNGVAPLGIGIGNL